jgi:hypothetical protein
MIQQFTLALILGLALAGAAMAQDQPKPAAQPKNDYGDGKTWLCRPGRQDACAVDLTTTVVAASGKLTRETWTSNPKAPIDCFYVYPTVSNDPTPNSDMDPGAEELSVIKSQFARFGSQCRVYAPLYRQITLTALRAGIAGKPMAIDRALAYNDVVDAWKYYLEHDNKGRGVVLIGHSQGSGVLTQLIKNEIDGKPVQSRLISALLLGTNLPVPRGKAVGGAFQHIPLCHSANQTGCVITYASFRATAPPPANSRFGRVPGENNGFKLHEPGSPARRQRRAALLPCLRRTRQRIIVGAQALGDASPGDQHAFCQRPRNANGGMRLQRQGYLSGDHGPQ